MTKPLIFDLAEWDRQLGGDDYYVIAHHLDKVIIGQVAEHREVLRQAIEDHLLIEAHFFNEKKEIFVSRNDRHLVAYRPLEHMGMSEQPSVVRCYRIEDHLRKQYGYSVLEVKEYIAHDDEDHLAYVEKTVLHRLLKG